MDNADKAKYGSILTGLNTQQSLGNDQYPTSITESNNVLSNHKFDAMPSKSGGKKNNSTDGNKNKDKKEDGKDDDDDEVNLSLVCSIGRQVLLLWQSRTQVSFVPRQRQTKRRMGDQQSPEPCTGNIKVGCRLSSSINCEQQHTTTDFGLQGGPERILKCSSSNLIRMKCEIGSYWITSQVSASFAIETWYRIYGSLMTVTCICLPTVEFW